MIIFSYKISDFVNNAQILSMYRASSAFNSGAEGVVDDTTISADDESFLIKYLKAGASMISQIISGYTKDLLDTDGITILEPFEFDVTYETIENSIVFRLNVPVTFNQAVIPAFDEAIKDALENYVLYRTAKLRAIENASYKEDFENSIGNIRSYLNRRTEGIRRSYKLF